MDNDSNPYLSNSLQVDFALQQIDDLAATLVDDFDFENEAESAFEINDFQLPEAPQPEEDYEELPALHEYYVASETKVVEEDIKNLPLIARLAILGAKIREDPTSWYFFCALKNSNVDSKMVSTGTKYVDLNSRTLPETLQKFTKKVESIETSVISESTKQNVFSSIAKLAAEDKAYISNTYNDAIRENCIKLITSEANINIGVLPLPTQTETKIVSFPFSISDSCLINNGRIVKPDVMQRIEYRDRSYLYLSFYNPDSRDSGEFYKMLKIVDWPNLLWKENKHGRSKNHYLLPVTSPATFKTWIFLQQYNKSLNAKQKIDRFAIINYASKIRHDAVDINNWYGPQSERKNLNGIEPCSRYRLRWFKNGKYQEPNSVPLMPPTGLCQMKSDCLCTCFVYPGELLGNLNIPINVVYDDVAKKYVKKFQRMGKKCFYCSSYYFGEKCENSNHLKNLVGCVKNISARYKINAVAMRNKCGHCPLIIRVSEDLRTKPLVGNEIIVKEEFFFSPQWKFMQCAYANSTVYVNGWKKPNAELLKTLDLDSNIRLEFASDELLANGDMRCERNKCDKLMTIFFNDKVSSIISSTIQPLQFQEGYILTLIPTKTDVSTSVKRMLEIQSSGLSVYDPNSKDSLLVDFRKREEKRKIAEIRSNLPNISDRKPSKRKIESLDNDNENMASLAKQFALESGQPIEFDPESIFMEASSNI